MSFSKYFVEYTRMENLDDKNEYIERKYLENMLDNQFLKAKSSLYEFKKKFKELKDRELNDRQEKNERDVEELFYKPITVSKVDIDKFEKEEIKKIRPIKKIILICWLNKVWWEWNKT